jgi:hypothetical protein
MKTISEQIRDLEATRAAKAARAQEVLQKSMDEGRSTDDAEAEEFDTLEGEIKQIDADMNRLRKAEQFAVQKGARVVAPVTGEDPVSNASRQRAYGPTIIVASKDKDEKFAGQNFTRKVIARALAHMEGIGGRSPAEIAQERWGKTNPTLVQVIKTGVAAGGSGSGDWGAELVTADNRYTGDFIEYLYGKTLFDQLPLKEIPANVTIKGQDGASSAFFIGENKAIKVTNADFSTVSLTPLKVAAIAALSKELVRDSSPAAEALVRDSLVQASSQKVDSTFFSTTAAVNGVSPAGILNSVAGHNTHGSTIDGVIGDIKQLYALFQSFKNASGLVVVTTPSQAKALSLMQNALGQFAFPGVTQMGGTLLGDTVYTGDNVTAGHLILMKPSDIYRIGDSGVSVSVTDVATIEQDDAPAGEGDAPTAASATLMSLWQTEQIGIKVVRSVNWAKRRSHAVQYIDNADYGATDTST